MGSNLTPHLVLQFSWPHMQKTTFLSSFSFSCSPPSSLPLSSSSSPLSSFLSPSFGFLGSDPCRKTYILVKVCPQPTTGFLVSEVFFSFPSLLAAVLALNKKGAMNTKTKQYQVSKLKSYLVCIHFLSSVSSFQCAEIVVFSPTG